MFAGDVFARLMQHRRQRLEWLELQRQWKTDDPCLRLRWWWLERAVGGKDDGGASW
jgi:hypothetical protein